MRFLILLFAVVLSVSANAQTRRLYVDIQRPGEPSSSGKGTAFCIGVTDTGNSLWATAKHNFDDMSAAFVLDSELRSYPVIPESVRKHPSEDVAVFESSIPVKSHYLLAESRPGDTVMVPGYGPEYHGRTACAFYGTVLNEILMSGEGNLHVITGDSGAPLLLDKKYVVGVAIGHESPHFKTSYRAEHRGLNLRTVYVKSQHIKYVLDQYYQYQQRCTPNGCYIYGSPTVVQPRMGITVPVGPPRVVGVTQPEPINSSPRNNQRPELLYPEPKAQPVVSDTDIQRYVTEWMLQNADKLKGPAGPAGKDGTNASQLPLKVILAKDGKKIDEEVIQPGEPLIIDVRSFESLPASRQPAYPLSGTP